MSQDPPLSQLDLSHIIPTLTVAQLKQCVRDIRAQFGYCIAISGNKPELVRKFQLYIAQNPTRVDAIQQIVRANSLSHAPGWALTNPSVAKVKTSFGSPSTSSTPHTPPTVRSPMSVTNWLKFRPNPFVEIVSHVTSPIICNEVYNQRNSVKFDFFLNTNQTSLLEPFSPDSPISTSQHQLLFYCTTIPTAYHQYPPPHEGSVVEFPPMCEIKVNGRPMEVNLRGIKKRPGSVHPPNITPYCSKGVINKVDFTYLNTHLKYVACVFLCRRNTVDEMIKEIKEKRYLSKELVLEKFQKKAMEKDDIVATQSSLSLRDPIAFHRINVPCRSSFCAHAQCFDAKTFLSMNEQTPTWTCPLCHRELKSWDEVIVDGYFDSILNSVPSDIDAVVLEPDWGWRLPGAPGNTSHTKETSREIITIVNLDDDDDDGGGERNGHHNGNVGGLATNKKRPRSLSPSTSLPSKRIFMPQNLIDLTLDSSDEEERGDVIHIDASVASSDNARRDSSSDRPANNTQVSQVKNETAKVTPAMETTRSNAASDGNEPVNGAGYLPSTSAPPVVVQGTPDASVGNRSHQTLSPPYPRLPVLPIHQDAAEDQHLPFANGAPAPPSVSTAARARMDVMYQGCPR